MLFNGAQKCPVWMILLLTRLPQDKMAAVLAEDNFKCNFLNETDRIAIRISLKFVSVGLIDNKPALVPVLAWRRTGDKPLPEPMLNRFTDAYMLTPPFVPFKWYIHSSCDLVAPGWQYAPSYHLNWYGFTKKWFTFHTRVEWNRQISPFGDRV